MKGYFNISDGVCRDNATKKCQDTQNYITVVISVGRYGHFSYHQPVRSPIHNIIEKPTSPGILHFPHYVPSRSFQSVLSRRRVQTAESTWSQIACSRTGCAAVASHLDEKNYIIRMVRVYFGLNSHLRLCVKCSAEVK